MAFIKAAVLTVILVASINDRYGTWVRGLILLRHHHQFIGRSAVVVHDGISTGSTMPAEVTRGSANNGVTISGSAVWQRQAETRGEGWRSWLRSSNPRECVECV